VIDVDLVLYDTAWDKFRDVTEILQEFNLDDVPLLFAGLVCYLRRAHRGEPRREGNCDLGDTVKGVYDIVRIAPTGYWRGRHKAERGALLRKGQRKRPGIRRRIARNELNLVRLSTGKGIVALRADAQATVVPLVPLVAHAPVNFVSVPYFVVLLILLVNVRLGGVVPHVDAGPVPVAIGRARQPLALPAFEPWHADAHPSGMVAYPTRAAHRQGMGRVNRGRLIRPRKPIQTLSKRTVPSHPSFEALAFNIRGRAFAMPRAQIWASSIGQKHICQKQHGNER
jgi:hypothetical protein